MLTSLFSFAERLFEDPIRPLLHGDAEGHSDFFSRSLLLLNHSLSYFLSLSLTLSLHVSSISIHFFMILTLNPPHYPQAGVDPAAEESMDGNGIFFSVLSPLLSAEHKHTQALSHTLTHSRTLNLSFFYLTFPSLLMYSHTSRRPCGFH